MISISETFAKRLKHLREEKSLSLEELSRQVDINAVTLGRWEKCQRTPSIESLFKLAKFFGVTSDYLIGLADI
jgi:transcriptional regulator with XRE-family HTH domain